MTSRAGVGDISSRVVNAISRCVVLLWSLACPGRPERAFTCTSPVLSARFDEADAHIVYGGTYSGQVVAWDTRVASTLPVQRTPLSAALHTHPVYALEVGRDDVAHPGLRGLTAKS